MKKSEILWQAQGELIWDWFGYSVASLGKNVIVGARLADVKRRRRKRKWGAGKVYLLSGKDGTLLWRVKGEVTGGCFGHSVAALGENVIVGALYADEDDTWGAGRVYLLSGKDGTVLWQTQGEAIKEWFGYSVASLGENVVVGTLPADVNGMKKAGKVYLLSGRDGTVLWQAEGEARGDCFGHSVASLGENIIVGAHLADVGDYLNSCSDKRNAGKVYLLSGRDGTVLWQAEGEAKGDCFGHSVAPLGENVIVGARLADVGGKKNAGKVYLLSGRDGTVLWQAEGEARGDCFGYAVASLGENVIVGARLGDVDCERNAGRVYLLSGRDGTVLWQAGGESVWDGFGHTVAPLGENIIVGAPLADVGRKRNAGKVYLLSFRPE